MTTPPITYRADKGAPLSIAEFDDNITALRARANHTGTQLAATIADLSTTVESFGYIVALQTNLTDLQNQVAQLSTDILSDAGLATQFKNIADKFTYLDANILAAQTSLASLAERVGQLELWRADVSSGIKGGTY